MIFVEIPSFTKRVARFLSDDELAEFQTYLSRHPDAGDLIRGSHGLRKVRWRLSTRGKRGGVRVIYFWHVSPEVITLLDIYEKSEKSDLSALEIKLLNRLLGV